MHTEPITFDEVRQKLSHVSLDIGLEIRESSKEIRRGLYDLDRELDALTDRLYKLCKHQHTCKSLTDINDRIDDVFLRLVSKRIHANLIRSEARIGGREHA